MSTVSPRERRKEEDLLGASCGYMLDFSKPDLCQLS